MTGQLLCDSRRDIPSRVIAILSSMMPWASERKATGENDGIATGLPGATWSRVVERWFWAWQRNLAINPFTVRLIIPREGCRAERNWIERHSSFLGS
jgi:hypothetical protein